jgi:hypothetical protein
MDWLLILWFALGGAPPERIEAGHMAGDQRICVIAGRGMKLVLEAANPGLTVTWACVYRGVSL